MLYGVQLSSEPTAKASRLGVDKSSGELMGLLHCLSGYLASDCAVPHPPDGPLFVLEDRGGELYLLSPSFSELSPNTF